MESTSIDTFRTSRSWTGRAVRIARMAFDRVFDWHERHRQRHALLGLDDRALRDIGLTRADAEREYGKAFWAA